MANLTDQQTRILQFLADNKTSATAPDVIAKRLGLNEREVRSDIRVLQEHGFVSGPPSLLSRCTEMLKEVDPDTDASSQEFPAWSIARG